CFASLASMFSKSGGPVVFVRAAFGDLAAFVTGWSTWIYSTTAIAALAVITAQFIRDMLPMAAVNNVLLAVVLLVVFTLVNLRGISLSARVEAVLIAFAILLMTIYVFTGLPTVDWSRFSFEFPENVNFGLAAVIGFELFIGWETATIIAEEVKNPKKLLPKALLLTVLVMAALYVGIITVFLGNTDLTVAATQANPLAATAATFGVSLAGLFSLVAVLVGLSAMNSWTTTVARLPHVMARQKLFPAYLDKLNSHGAPSRALMLQLGIATVIAATGSFELAIILLLSVGLVMYILVFISLLKLKGTRPALFPVPKLFPVLGVVTLVFMLVSLPPQILATGWLLIIAGLPAYVLVKLITDRKFIEKWWDRISWFWAWYWPAVLYRKGMQQKVLAAAKLKDGMCVLDYGCGTGITTAILSGMLPRGKVVAADISREQLSRALTDIRKIETPNVMWVKNTRPAPFPKGCFDRIICTIAINYFVNPGRELSALRKTLRKGGRAVFLAVRSPGIVSHPFLHKDNAIRSNFTKAGWKGVRIEHIRKPLREWILITATGK
ncbi:MAG: amino acid permease, partial [Candidatus Aenigmatarchaeota archaeon]